MYPYCAAPYKTDVSTAAASADRKLRASHATPSHSISTYELQRLFNLYLDRQLSKKSVTRRWLQIARNRFRNRRKQSSAVFVFICGKQIL